MKRYLVTISRTGESRLALLVAVEAVDGAISAGLKRQLRNWSGTFRALETHGRNVNLLTRREWSIVECHKYALYSASLEQTTEFLNFFPVGLGQG